MQYPTAHTKQAFAAEGIGALGTIKKPTRYTAADFAAEGIGTELTTKEKDRE